MTSTTSPEPEKSDVQLREEENEALRQELAALRAESAAAEAEAESGARLVQLDSEAQRIQTEINYEKQLKAARLGVKVSDLEPKPDSGQEEEPPAPATPAPAPATPAKADADAEAKDSGGKSATNGKEK